MKKILFSILIIVFLVSFSEVSAHQSGCHRWHSCPSDTGSYVCGDLGYDSQCPKVPPKKPVVVETKKVENSVSTPKKISQNNLDPKCITQAIDFGNKFLISKGYKENKNGSWTNSRGLYLTSKIETELEKKETDVYVKCLGKK